MKRTLVTDIEADRLRFRAVEIAQERDDALEAEGDHAGALRWREKAEAFAEYFTTMEAEKRKKANVNLNEIELLSDLYLDEPVDICPDLSITPTYAHVMSPFVMAFAPVSAGRRTSGAVAVRIRRGNNRSACSGDPQAVLVGRRIRSIEHALVLGSPKPDIRQQS